MTNTDYDRRPTYEEVYNRLYYAIHPELNVREIRSRLQLSKQDPKYDNPMMFENCNFDGTLGTMMTDLTLNTSQPVSMVVHDQEDSQLCWAFSTATMIRSSLKIFFEDQVFPYVFNGHHKINEQDTPSEFKKLVKFLQYVRNKVNSDEFHRIVKHQLR